MAVGTDRTAANSANLAATLEKLNTAIPGLYESQSKTYKDVLANSVSIETPDKTLNEAFQWAVISIEQLKTKTRGLGTAQTTTGNSASAGADPEETALIAGYFDSADSARPGFGWFFGRDALYTLYAVNGYGNFTLSKSELEFLMRRQRPDGKIMHEWSQTAGAIDWQAFPYMYAAADATPLFLLTMLDYVRASGDTAFLTAHRDAIEKAWSFETSHTSDNGIYDNTQGTGWVESWPGGLPHQEVYLALLDQQASAAMARIEDLLQDKQKSAAAQQRSETIKKTIDAQFYDQEKNCYAFSRNANGSLDRTSTVYPALAWWTSPSVTGNPEYLAHPDGCLRQFADASLNTDWGLRDVSSQERIYDGMSYHQGSVWPLFTGWAAIAEYRGNQPLAGYQMLMENANLTWAQDLGAHTELLSGDFFVPFGRSTSHQLWSSAMVITPTLRGLFGLDIDAQSKTITVNPHLPAAWDRAELLNLQLPGEKTDLYFTRNGDRLEIYMIPTEGDAWHLRSELPGATIAPVDVATAKKIRISPHVGLRIPLPALEVDYSLGDLNPIESVKLVQPIQPPSPGARASKIRIVQSENGDHKLVLTVEGPAGSVGIVSLIRNGHFVPKARTEPSSAPDASISFRACDANPYACKSLPLLLQFPPGEGWKTITVTLTW